MNNMIKNFKFLYGITSILFIVFFASACIDKNDQQKNLKKSHSDIFSGNWLLKINANKIIDTLSFKIIRLESNMEGMIGKIDKMIVTEDYIIIFDMEFSKAVLVFSRDGKFVRKIGKQGRGIGEYARLSDVGIDRQEKLIILYDINFRKLIFYNYNGSFIKEIKLSKYYGMKFSNINGSQFAFYLHFSPEFSDELLFVNDKGKIVKSLFERRNKEIKSIFLNSTYLASNDSNLYIIPSYCGKIYQIKDVNDITEKFDFEVDDKMITDDDIKGVNNSMDILKLKKFTSIKRLFVNNKEQFFCNSTYDNQRFIIVGDMRSGKFIPFSDFTSRKNAPGIIVSTYEDYFITTKHTLDFPILFPFANISDNPCLVFFKLKGVS
jgi:hypothetical protein